MMFLFFMMYIHLMKIKNNYLCYLIGLEYISSYVLFLMILNKFEMWMFMFTLVYLVCEAVTGLTLMVSFNFMSDRNKSSLLSMC